MKTTVIVGRGVPRQNVEIRVISSDTSKAEELRIDRHFHFTDRPFGEDHNPRRTISF